MSYYVLEIEPRFVWPRSWRVCFITVDGSYAVCKCDNKHDAERIADALNKAERAQRSSVPPATDSGDRNE